MTNYSGILLFMQVCRLSWKRREKTSFLKMSISLVQSPTDSLGINDYYKVYGYACFYKSETEEQDSISITEITLTFVSRRYPRTLVRHLQEVRGHTVKKRENGIYIVNGDIFPIQLIVIKELSQKENLWLHSLTDDIEDVQEAEKLVLDYEKHRKSTLYESVMDIIVRANYHKFKEVNNMCQALVEIMQPYITEQVEIRVKEQLEIRVKEQVERQVKEQVERQVKEQVDRQVKEQVERQVKEREKIVEQTAERGISKAMELTRVLIAAGRMEDLTRAIDDDKFRNCLYEELALS